MKFDFSQPLKEFDGTYVSDPGTGRDLTLQRAAFLALAAVPQKEEDKVSDVEKERQYDIAMKIRENEEATELSLDEAALVCKLICRTFQSPVIVGQVRKIFNSPI